MKKFNKLFYSGLGIVVLLFGAGVAVVAALVSSSYTGPVTLPKTDTLRVFTHDSVIEKPAKTDTKKPKSHKKAMVIDTTKTVIVADTTTHEKHI